MKQNFFRSFGGSCLCGFVMTAVVIWQIVAVFGKCDLVYASLLFAAAVSFSLICSHETALVSTVGVGLLGCIILFFDPGCWLWLISAAVHYIYARLWEKSNRESALIMVFSAMLCGIVFILVGWFVYSLIYIFSCI